MATAYAYPVEEAVAVNEAEPFSLPTDGRKAKHQRERRRLLYQYLKDGPKNFFKSILTISREMNLAWQDLHWSRRTIFRTLAELHTLGLIEPGKLRCFQGTRERRINKGYQCESGTSGASQGRRKHRKKTDDQRESGTSATARSESGTSEHPNLALLGRESGTERFSLNSYGFKNLGFRENIYISHPRVFSSSSKPPRNLKPDDADERENFSVPPPALKPKPETLQQNTRFANQALQIARQDPAIHAYSARISHCNGYNDENYTSESHITEILARTLDAGIAVNSVEYFLRTLRAEALDFETETPQQHEQHLSAEEKVESMVCTQASPEYPVSFSCIAEALPAIPAKQLQTILADLCKKQNGLHVANDETGEPVYWPCTDQCPDWDEYKACGLYDMQESPASEPRPLASSFADIRARIYAD